MWSPTHTPEYLKALQSQREQEIAMMRAAAAVRRVRPPRDRTRRPFPRLRLMRIAVRRAG